MATCIGNDGDVSGVRANGIHNTDLIKNSGIFTCENPGLYLISVFITSNDKNGYYNVSKNNNPIAYGQSSVTDWHKTSSMTVIAQLTVNTTISVQGSVYAYGTIQSCLTILQIQ